MKLNFKVKSVQVVESTIDGTITRNNSSYSLPSIEAEAAVTGIGIKNSVANVDIHQISEELHSELLTVINKIENKLNSK